jgi:hypothetical protein
VYVPGGQVTGPVDWSPLTAGSFAEFSDGAVEVSSEQESSGAWMATNDEQSEPS